VASRSANGSRPLDVAGRCQWLIGVRPTAQSGSIRFSWQISIRTGPLRPTDRKEKRGSARRQRGDLGSVASWLCRPFGTLGSRGCDATRRTEFTPFDPLSISRVPIYPDRKQPSSSTAAKTPRLLSPTVTRAALWTVVTGYGGILGLASTTGFKFRIWPPRMYRVAPFWPRCHGIEEEPGYLGGPRLLIVSGPWPCQVWPAAISRCPYLRSVLHLST